MAGRKPRPKLCIDFKVTPPPVDLPEWYTSDFLNDGEVMALPRSEGYICRVSPSLNKEQELFLTMRYCYLGQRPGPEAARERQQIADRVVTALVPLAARSLRKSQNRLRQRGQVTDDGLFGGAMNVLIYKFYQELDHFDPRLGNRYSTYVLAKPGILRGCFSQAIAGARLSKPQDEFWRRVVSIDIGRSPNGTQTELEGWRSSRQDYFKGLSCSDAHTEKPVRYLAGEITTNLQEIVEKCLGERDWHVVCLYFGLDGEDKQTLQEVGDLYEVSRERVRQIIKRAIQVLYLYFSTRDIRSVDDYINAPLFGEDPTFLIRQRMAESA